MAEKDISEKSYDKETEFFYKTNREIIDRQRQALDSRRAEQRAKALKEQHWMCCPKCGHEMTETQLCGIMVDRCSVCEGIYFDRGELELLLQSREPQGFLAGLKCWFK